MLGELTDLHRGILELERRWFKRQGAKETQIRERFDMSPTRYDQVLNAIIDHPDAIAVDALTVKRLARLRAQGTATPARYAETPLLVAVG